MEHSYVLASGNRGKLREIEHVLGPLGFALRPQSEWRIPEAAEDAVTFVENSLIKARHASRHTGLPAIADDSGLVVPALNGAPGILSSRYAGEGADDQANIRKLLAELGERPAIDRRAYFYCVIVLLNSADDPAPLVATGRWFGEILESPRGDGGFGYDPVFGISGAREDAGLCSVAELAPALKSRLSHRGQALKSLVSQLCERNAGQFD